MKRTILATMILLSVNAHADGFVTGKVIEVQPLQSQQRQSCHMEQQQSSYQPQQNYQQQSTAGGELLGAIVGGIAGAQIGNGNGRVVAAAVGSAIGTHAGQRISQRQQNQNSYVQVCDRADNQSSGYRIAVHVGREFFRFTTMNSYSEGDQVQIRLSASLVEDNRGSQQNDYQQSRYQNSDNQGRRLTGFQDNTNAW